MSIEKLDRVGLSLNGSDLRLTHVCRSSSIGSDGSMFGGGSHRLSLSSRSFIRRDFAITSKVSFLPSPLLFGEDPVDDTDGKEYREESKGDPSEREKSTSSRADAESNSTATIPSVERVVRGRELGRCSYVETFVLFQLDLSSGTESKKDDTEEKTPEGEQSLSEALLSQLVSVHSTSRETHEYFSDSRSRHILALMSMSDDQKDRKDEHGEDSKDE